MNGWFEEEGHDDDTVLALVADPSTNHGSGSTRGERRMMMMIMNTK